MYSFALKKAILEATVSCFWFHSELRDFMLGCDVPPRFYDAQVTKAGSKRKYVHMILQALDERGEPGHRILNKIAVELLKLSGPVHPDKLDSDVAKQRLSDLRVLASREGLLHNVNPVKAEEFSVSHNNQAELDALKDKFYQLTKMNDDPQGRGRQFQDLIADLFKANNIEYHPPFRPRGQEIDGMFIFESRRYLLEARWRKDEADFNALSHFHSKCVTKLHGTVGIFISIEGFSEEALTPLDKLGESRFLLLDGVQFVKIIDQIPPLPDALKQMVDHAHKYGSRKIVL